jgi:hypothetical protein
MACQLWAEVISSSSYIFSVKVCEECVVMMQYTLERAFLYDVYVKYRSARKGWQKFGDEGVPGIQRTHKIRTSLNRH